METREIVHRIEQKFGKNVVSASDEGTFPHVMIAMEELRPLLRYCVEEGELRFDFLECLSGCDTGQELVVIYQLYSVAFAHRINVKVAVDRHKAKLPSVVSIWRAAHSYELETAEMFGIEFDGHPDARHLLLPEDWVGYPLRKDYVYPEEYHGIEHRRAPLRKEHVRP